MKCPTCQIEIREHPEGACLDALFCTEVMKWKVSKVESYWAFWDESAKIPHWKEIGYFKPSTNIQHAMEGVEKFANDDHVLELMWIPRYLMEQKPFWNFMISENKIKTVPEREESSKQVRAFADTKELAITRALILWAVEKK